jgi:phospholipase C
MLTWKSYFSDLPFLAFWYAFAATHLLNFATIDQFADDGMARSLPHVSILDPPFTLADDHPPHNPALGEKFIGLVVDALTTSPAGKILCS